ATLERLTEGQCEIRRGQRLAFCSQGARDHYGADSAMNLRLMQYGSQTSILLDQHAVGIRAGDGLPLCRFSEVVMERADRLWSCDRRTGRFFFHESRDWHHGSRNRWVYRIFRWIAARSAFLDLEVPRSLN